MLKTEHLRQVDDAPNTLVPFLKTSGFDAARKLWNGIKEPAHGALIVVAETRGSTYKGFWIPDVRTGGEALPGAPRALAESEPQAVFVDDLPPFPLDPEICERWKKYLKGDQPGQFRGRMFISIPVSLRLGIYDRVATAVINVNVTGNSIWRRAYSKHWLKLAAARANAWACTALHALGLAFHLEGRIVDGLQLPPFAAPRQLPPKG